MEGTEQWCSSRLESGGGPVRARGSIPLLSALERAVRPAQGCSSAGQSSRLQSGVSQVRILLTLLVPVGVIGNTPESGSGVRGSNPRWGAGSGGPRSGDSERGARSRVQLPPGVHCSRTNGPCSSEGERASCLRSSEDRAPHYGCGCRRFESCRGYVEENEVCDHRFVAWLSDSCWCCVRCGHMEDPESTPEGW